ncbi:MAG: hypothetical protein NZ942_02750 [Candidatus Aenigmarchaeota archaeon]|nr:hypothetical protein [Candidatus Aenigmarchaeota archaeon]
MFLIFLFFIILGIIVLNPQIFNFQREERKGCIIENEIKEFLSRKAKEYSEIFPHASLESGFPIGYEKISENYSICYFSNFVCKKTDSVFSCKGVIMPFEIFCFNYQNLTVCLKEFTIDKSFQVLSLACEIAPEQVSKYYC